MAEAPSEVRLRRTGQREHPHCFACSEPAQVGLGLQFSLQPDDSVAATWGCPVDGESFPGIIHGGLVATLLDAAMVHALFARGVVAVTAALRIRFCHSVLIGSPVVVQAWLRGRHGSLFRLEAKLRQGTSLCARAEGKFMARGDFPPPNDA